MKNFLLCLLVLILSTSCSQDSDNKTIVPFAGNAIKLSAENPSNHMDKEGKKYYEALQIYLKENDSPSSIAQMTDQLNFTSGSISPNNSTGRGVILFTDEWVESIMEDPDNSLITIVQSSNLTLAAQNNVIDFLQNLLSQRQEEFSVQCNFIVSYENDLINNTTLIEDEKDTLLTVASISRYSLYSEAERKDRDWEKSVGRNARNFLKPNEEANITTIAFLKKLISN